MVCHEVCVIVVHALLPLVVMIIVTILCQTHTHTHTHTHTRPSLCKQAELYSNIFSHISPYISNNIYTHTHDKKSAYNLATRDVCASVGEVERRHTLHEFGTVASPYQRKFIQLASSVFATKTPTFQPPLRRPTIPLEGPPCRRTAEYIGGFYNGIPHCARDMKIASMQSAGLR
eukprot:GHVR01001087.1.p1 GENE.GHVR01001087.1~~GHVR01001087.1.p1  ORF type:complete len:174 (+),score=51.15 GHVR01001087.1:136-657(+)